VQDTVPSTVPTGSTGTWEMPAHTHVEQDEGEQDEGEQDEGEQDEGEQNEESTSP